ncbi:hypothetical protein M407DRAFT_123220 [Tulasnella calospora MUT 4182]|uniref:Uncharacterized protein n=1 Tax=Tulasnella calospora MUT 4182 TaxID=1051891 RepID=A0A0C3LKK9_9AGAM|nr:hypothetical protein M407DRAFT_123220 [Tulasnella calospora MUT 4182]
MSASPALWLSWSNFEMPQPTNFLARIIPYTGPKMSCPQQYFDESLKPRRGALPLRYRICLAKSAGLASTQHGTGLKSLQYASHTALQHWCYLHHHLLQPSSTLPRSAHNLRLLPAVDSGE